MNKPEIKSFIRENAHLFWYFKDDEKENISPEVLVEFILNYGDDQSVKNLFDLLGIETVASIFRKQTAQKRVNYHKRTKHYFTLYFNKHAHQHPV